MTTAERVLKALSNSPLSKQPKVLKFIEEKIDAYEATKHETNPKNVKRPHAVYCHVTGIKCGMTATAYFEKKLFEYGDDIFTLMTTYVSRGAKGSAPAKRPAVASAKVSAPAPDTVIVAPTPGNVEYSEVSAYKDAESNEPLITTTTFEVNGVATVIFDYNHDSGKTSYRLGDKDKYMELKSR